MQRSLVTLEGNVIEFVLWLCVRACVGAGDHKQRKFLNIFSYNIVKSEAEKCGFLIFKITFSRNPRSILLCSEVRNKGRSLHAPHDLWRVSLLNGLSSSRIYFSRRLMCCQVEIITKNKHLRFWKQCLPFYCAYSVSEQLICWVPHQVRAEGQRDVWGGMNCDFFKVFLIYKLIPAL